MIGVLVTVATRFAPSRILMISSISTIFMTTITEFVNSWLRSYLCLVGNHGGLWSGVERR